MTTAVLARVSLPQTVTEAQCLMDQHSVRTPGGRCSECGAWFERCPSRDLAHIAFFALGALPRRRRPELC